MEWVRLHPLSIWFVRKLIKRAFNLCWGFFLYLNQCNTRTLFLSSLVKLYDGLNIFWNVILFSICVFGQINKSQIREFSQAILDYPLHSNGLVDVPKVLADIVESVVGAVFIDCDFSMDTVWKVLSLYLIQLFIFTINFKK